MTPRAGLPRTTGVSTTGAAGENRFFLQLLPDPANNHRYEVNRDDHLHDQRHRRRSSAGGHRGLWRNAAGAVHKSYTYDSRLNLTGVTYTSAGQNYTTRYTYDNPPDLADQIGEIVEKREALGWPEERATSYTYSHRTDDPFLLTQSTETKTSVVSPSQNKVTTTAYDNQGNVVSRTQTGYVLINGTPTHKTDVTQYQYNAAGRAHPDRRPQD